MMLICELDLNRSSDVGLISNYGFSVRDVFIERGGCGSYFVRCLNEFTQDEIILGEIKPSMVVAVAMSNWLDFLHEDEFMAIYIGDYEVVVIDHYYPIGRL